MKEEEISESNNRDISKLSSEEMNQLAINMMADISRLERRKMLGRRLSYSTYIKNVYRLKNVIERQRSNMDDGEADSKSSGLGETARNSNDKEAISGELI